MKGSLVPYVSVGANSIALYRLQISLPVGIWLLKGILRGDFINYYKGGSIFGTTVSSKPNFNNPVYYVAILNKARSGSNGKNWAGSFSLILTGNLK